MIIARRLHVLKGRHRVGAELDVEAGRKAALLGWCSRWQMVSSRGPTACRMLAKAVE